MNKRTLSDDRNMREKNKSGVKRYLMSSDDIYDNPKIYHEKNNGGSKINMSTFLEINEDGMLYDNHNNNIMNGHNNDMCDLNNGNNNIFNSLNKIDNNNNINDNELNKINSENNNNNNNNNNNSNSNTSLSTKYYSNDCKKRKGSRYTSSLPFLKKEKNSGNTVLILKNVPEKVDEEDIISFMRPFLRNKNPEIIFDGQDIIVKLYDDELIESIYTYFNQHPTQIKGSFVKVKISKENDDNKESKNEHNNIINNNNSNNNNSNSNYSCNNNNYSCYNNDDYSLYSNHATDTSDKRYSKSNKAECSKVILVSVINLHYPVDIELIYYLFSKCGTVEKIITFSRNPVLYQALIQFDKIETAKEAIKTLHNRNIYDGCNTINIQYSFLKELVIKGNNSSSWDYTLSSEKKTKNYPEIQNSHGVLPTPTRKSIDSELYQLMEKKFKLVDFEKMNPSKTPVLICYNIPKEYTDVNKLFNLFSIYGFVTRIKILREKPDAALIQYSNYIFSSLAQEYLQRARINNQNIEVNFSKIHDIRVSQRQQNHESHNTKMFSNYDQRYVLSDQGKYIKAACRPTKCLFISNLNEDVNEDCVMNLFNKYGNINKFQFLPVKEGKRHLSIIVEMNTEDMATKALMDLHNFYLKDRHIKVSYTKSRLM
ncbi:polypyrimidine tract binding protein, putative [Plasmodium sp. gorilla clade G2]|uniref:polypyrimidine tract binding protein, putative n=1 Tax=Plasmodium sp. gorilla clade G2 TaxID=880535 RepID=UPI000D211714|nr:polypyrimidine tract binding protein, putative [Plasmodium sp. gorilla clade G2]SOV12388.1 polypyrimidine tract binding protein, putative [Plasmodium sp. gorilla clade G2]